MPLGGFDSRNLREALRSRPEAADEVAVRRRGGGGCGEDDDVSCATGTPCSPPSSSSTLGNCSMVVYDYGDWYNGVCRGIYVLNK